MALILGLESSCDDSAAALVTSDRAILAQAVVGQDEAHRPFGGIVPEIAARAHVVHPSHHYCIVGITTRLERWSRVGLRARGRITTG